MSIRLLAIDLDGTLLDPSGRVPPACASAIARAREAGLRVVICTGRGLVECRFALEAIDQRDPVVVAGGSIIADPSTGRTIHRFPMAPDLVGHAVTGLLRHRHPALVLKDPSSSDLDYLVVQGDQALPLDPVTIWWFERTRARWRSARSLDEDMHPEHTVRVGACGLSGTLATIRRDLEEAVAGRAHVHHFPAVAAPHHVKSLPDGQSLHILELFDAGATKWSALSRLLEDWGIMPTEVAAIGDEINDVSMIQGAGLGIAMGNAVQAVLDVADVVTTRNDEHGVAHAIERVLSREWVTSA